MTERADDPPTDLLEDRGNVRIAGRLDLEKARLEALVGPIEIGPLQEDNMRMDISIEGATETLDKRHRSRLDLLPLATAFDRLVDVILTNRGADNRMDLCRQFL